MSSGWRDRLKRPVFLVSPPRSGSTLLFQTLMHSPSLASIGRESHGLIEGVPALHPSVGGWESNRLTAAEAVPEVVEELSRRFGVSMRDRDNRPTAELRLLEKTPKNSLRVPFLREAYPDAAFVYLYRDARATLSSMMEAWRSGRFRTYPRLPEWSGLPWSLLLVPGWRALRELPLHHIVARQWATTTEILLGDLEQLAPEQLRSVDYAAFVADPQGTIAPLCRSLELAWDVNLPAKLPMSATTVSAPDADKWRVNEAQIAEVWPELEALDARAREFRERLATS